MINEKLKNRKFNDVREPQTKGLGVALISSPENSGPSKVTKKTKSAESLVTNTIGHQL